MKRKIEEEIKKGNCGQETVVAARKGREKELDQISCLNRDPNMVNCVLHILENELYGLD